jgi:putative membrane protein
MAIGALCFSGSAFAINLFPPKRTPKPASSASPAASASQTATTKTESAAGTLSAKDKAFMRKAAKGGMMEVAMGKMAEEKGQSEGVKAFGKRMVADHSKANEELMALAEKKGMKLPGEKPAQQWSSDKDYMNMMVKDHEKDLSEFQAEASSGTDSDLKKFADRTAKVVQKHLDLAKETLGKLQ